jgi:hypothetical protein
LPSTGISPMERSTLPLGTSMTPDPLRSHKAQLAGEDSVIPGTTMRVSAQTRPEVCRHPFRQVFAAERQALGALHAYEQETVGEPVRGVGLRKLGPQLVDCDVSDDRNVRLIGRHWVVLRQSRQGPGVPCSAPWPTRCSRAGILTRPPDYIFQLRISIFKCILCSYSFRPAIVALFEGRLIYAVYRG